jgi:PAS domain S-box-containing protein
MISPQTPIRILIVEDDEHDFLITCGYIKKIPGSKFIIDWCPTYEEALEKISQSLHDIYFVDYFLDYKTGLDLLEQAIKLGYEDPIILLTGMGNPELDLKAIRMGAIDFLVKSELNTEKLERCIRYSLERSQATQALKSNERKFRSIFEKSRDAIFLADKNLFFEDVNPATCELFEYTTEELQMISLYDLIADPELRILLKEQLEKTGNVDDREVELLTRNRQRKNCILSISKEIRPNGRFYIQGIIHDITHLRRMENASLQIKKLQSTAGLAKILAHEIRNPLTNINLATDQLNAEFKNGVATECLTIIGRNSKRIDALITELLDSSRPREILLEKNSLQTILNKSLSNAIDRISLKRIKLETIFPEEPAEILCDHEKLNIAFLNIIINAIEAMPVDNGHLVISIVDESAHYKVLISDNGTGISTENLTRIFEPHYSSKTTGFGLGLSTSLNILEAHKAFTDVHSQLGLGTTFVMIFEKTWREKTSG